jgi:hypothetical protein
VLLEDRGGIIALQCMLSLWDDDRRFHQSNLRDRTRMRMKTCREIMLTQGMFEGDETRASSEAGELVEWIDERIRLCRAFQSGICK